jgi:hypothetical protein
LANLTFSRCFVQSVSSRDWNEVIPVVLKISHPYFFGNLRQENKIRKSMEIAAFKVKFAICQCWPSAIPTWISGATEVQLMQTQFFWIPDSKAYQRSTFQPKTMSYERDMGFQIWQLNSANKQVSWRNEPKLHFEACKPISKLLFQKFSSSKSKFEDFMQGYLFFFRKIVIEVLKCKQYT